MAENLRLTLILQARDRAVEVIKRVGQGGAKTAEKLRQARQRLKRAFEAVRRETARLKQRQQNLLEQQERQRPQPGGRRASLSRAAIRASWGPPDGKRPRPKRASHGVQMGFFDAAAFIEHLKNSDEVQPHMAQSPSGRRLAVPGRIAPNDGYRPIANRCKSASASAKTGDGARAGRKVQQGFVLNMAANHPGASAFADTGVL